MARDRGHLHDALYHLRYSRRREAMVAMPALFLDAEKTSRSHTRQMAARRLWRDAGDVSQLGCREGASVHERAEHSSAGGIPGKCRNFCECGQASHRFGLG